MSVIMLNLKTEQGGARGYQHTWLTGTLVVCLPVIGSQFHLQPWGVIPLNKVDTLMRKRTPDKWSKASKKSLPDPDMMFKCPKPIGRLIKE